MRPQRQLAGKIEAVPRRRGERRRQARPRSRSSTASRGRAAEASRISWRGTPSVSGKMVRRLSWRSTRSPSAASSAATVERAREPQRQRDRVGRARDLPGDRGTTAGAAQTTAEARPDAATPTQRRPRRLRRRPGAWPAPPRSGLRTGCGWRPRHPSVARMRLISRVASSEWPPSAKKLSSMPTRSSAQHLGEQRAQDLLLRRARRARHACAACKLRAPAAPGGRACRSASAAAAPAARTPTAPCSRAGCCARCARSAAASTARPAAATT